MVFDLLSSLILVVKNFFLLIIFPYRTMRRLSRESDYGQVFILFLIIFLYFKFAYFLRDKPYPASLTFLIFILHFSLTVAFFYGLSRVSDNKIKLFSFVFTLSYSFIPTLIWFASSSILYIIVPPPRSLSVLGKGFSIFFIAYSVSLLSWKMILMYLALRFSARSGFYRIIYMLVLFLLWFIPYSVLLYHLKLFRIPFI